MKKIIFTLLSLALFTANMSAQWETDYALNNSITPGGFPMWDYAIKQGNQCTYIAYNSPVLGIENVGYYLQILDANGVKKFSDPGLLISAEASMTYTVVSEILFADNAGNAIIAVPDLRKGGGVNTYTLYKVSPEGTMLWGDNGVDLSGVSDYGVACMQMTELANGNLVFAWEKVSSASVHMRLVSPDGELLGSEFVKDEKMCGYPYIVPSGDGVILLYSERNGTGSPWSRYSSLKAQKFNSNFEPQWASALTIYSQGYTIPALYGVFDVVSDGNDGVLVAWYDSHVNAQREYAYVAHILSDGTSAFAGSAFGQRVGNHSTYKSFRPTIVADVQNSAFHVIWEESNDNQSYTRMMVQKYLYDGTEVWAAGGQQIDDSNGAATVGYQSAQNGPEGKVAFFYQKLMAPNSTTFNYAVLLDADGNYVWTDEKVNFTTSEYYRADLLSTPLINNEYWLTIWRDARNDDDLNDNPLFLQKINVEQIPDGAKTVFDLDKDKVAVYPNPGEDFIYFSKRVTSAEIYNVDGRLLQTEIIRDNSLNISSLKQGIYLISMQTENGKVEEKFVKK